MSDDEDDMIESVNVSGGGGGGGGGGEEQETEKTTSLTHSFNTFSSQVLHDPETGEALYGSVRQIKMQLGF